MFYMPIDKFNFISFWYSNLLLKLMYFISRNKLIVFSIGEMWNSRTSVVSKSNKNEIRLPYYVVLLAKTT